MLGFMAINVAITIQSALGSCNPKAMAAEPARASARIRAKSTTGRVSFTEEKGSPGRSMTGRGRHLHLLTNHTMPVNAIHTADPISQASDWSHPVVLIRSAW